MAVYTVLDQLDIETLIKPFGIGPLLSFKGAADGVENTTYFISTDHSQLNNKEYTADQQDYVITLFEELETKHLDYYVDLTTALADNHLPVPAPLTDYNGKAVQEVQGKPALLFPKAPGQHPQHLHPQQCHNLGVAMAKMHLVSRTLDLYHNGNRSFGWLAQRVEQIKGCLGEKDRSLLDQEIAHFANLLDSQPDLPQGIIHNDLFTDNTLFEGDQLTAIIDFYNACNGFLLHDLAIAVNDWCSEKNGSINTERYHALISGYQGLRPFTEQEHKHWADFLRINATRFWVSRLAAIHLPESAQRKGGLNQHKDPEQYKTILLQRINQTLPLSAD
jgi:homoserine kinase type II